MLSWLWRWRISVVAAAVVLAVVAFGAILVFSGPPARKTPSASLAAGGRTHATLEVVSGTPVLRIGVARLGGTLLRAFVPHDAAVRPVLSAASGSAPVRLSLVPAGGARRGADDPVTVQLNSDVAWQLDFAAGTQTTVADLRGARVGGITFGAGSAILDVTMPAPSGTVVITLAGGASQFRLALPRGVPARITAGGGLAQVTMDSLIRTGVAGGTVITPPGWATATSRFDIDATAGVDRIAVSRWRG
ncbi:MAG: hypothetical protein JOY82_06775 [Streptosporangiaceae bacterium]|nr:hypothetical protein [Streptosporangiaceae bacterium]